MIGREKELQRVVDLLTGDAARLVTLTGPGGIGKTRLAIAASREVEASFPDGIAFVDLAPLRDPRLVIPRIAAAIGVRDLGDAPLQAKVARALDRRRVLLLLDNVEHVVDAAADLSALLNDSSVSMLATSRIPLRIDGELSVPLTPLPSATAIQLFVERARAVKPEFELTDDNAADVAAIATAVDNVPLALELAAARLRVLTPAALSERLDRVLPLLVWGARNGPERQRTLRATIDWSAQLLSEEERELLLRLGVFRGGFSLEAAQWMCEGLDATSAVNLLTALVESSLVQEQDRGSRSWFSMLATVREYARDELERRGDLQKCLQRHAEFFSELAVRAEPQLMGAGHSAWIARLRDEFEDIRSAIEHDLDTEQGDAVAKLLWPLSLSWSTTARLSDLRDWVNRLANVGYEVSEQTRFRAKFYVVGLATWTNPDPSRIPDFEDCVAYFSREHDPFAEFLARIAIAMLELMRGSSGLDSADQDLQRAQSIAEESQSPFLTTMVLLVRGQSFLARGNAQDAIATFEASLDAAKVSGEVLSQSVALYQLGWAQLFLGNHGAARDYFIQLLLTTSAVGHEEGVAFGLEGMFAVAVAVGEFERAGRLLGTADDIRERRGLLGPGMFSYAQQVLAQVESSPAAEGFNIAREQGRHVDVDKIVEEALT